MTMSYLTSILALLYATSINAQSPHSHTKKIAETKDEKFSESVEGLEVVKQTTVVDLKDGDSYTIIAAPVKQLINGKWMRRLAYNGQIPGPTLRVKQGSKVRVVLKNSTEVDTTLHPHGLRVDDKNDGVPGVGQPPIKPTGAHDYDFKFPDAGIYWYHPHIREDYTQDAGLYGNFLVTPKEDNFYNAVHREEVLALDDVSTTTPYFKNKATHTLMGRFGDVMQINGQSDYKLSLRTNEVVRLFLTNTANARVFLLKIPGVRLKLVGGDNGLYEKEEWVDSLTIAPSERFIVEFRIAKPGDYDIVNAKPSGVVKLGAIEVKEGKLPFLIPSFDLLKSNSKVTADLKSARAKMKAKPDFKVRLTMTMDHSKLPMEHHSSAKKSSGRQIEWDDDMASMNAKSDDKNLVWKLVDETSNKENMDINWIIRKGNLLKIRIFNDPKSMHPMHHPIHFHGQRFVVASIDGKTPSNLVWKDSVLVASGETTELILEASNPGRWMAHCHIAEHLSAGMMMGFEVKE